MKIIETTTNMEAERGVLGCCLLDPQIRVFEVHDAHGNDAVNLFNDEYHRSIWLALLEILDGGTTIDILQVSMVLKKYDEKKAPPQGWIAFMTELQDTVPSSENLSYYLKEASNVYLARKAGAFFNKFYKKLGEETGNIQKLMEQAEGELMALNSDPVGRELQQLSDLLPVVQDQIEHYKRGGAQLTGLSTGFDYLDKQLGGMRGGEMLVVCGRPGEGKTAFGMNIAANVALNGTPVLVFSLEMSALELARRVLFAEADADMQMWRTGFAQESEIPDLTNDINTLMDVPMFIDERPALTMNQVRSKARQAKLMHNIGLVVVDYLQLAKGEEGRNAQYSREQEVASVSRGIKQMAKELDVPVIACAQLNRNAAQSKTQKPTLADLRESGQIEQDADMVAALWPVPETAESAEEQKHWSQYTTRTDFLILKQRSGPVGHCKFIFKKSSVSFQPYHQSEEQEAREEGIIK